MSTSWHPASGIRWLSTCAAVRVEHMMCTFSELAILLEQPQTGAAFSALSQIVGH